MEEAVQTGDRDQPLSLPAGDLAAPPDAGSAAAAVAGRAQRARGKPGQTHRRGASRWSTISPTHLLVILAVLIFFAELCDMLILHSLPAMPPWLEALLDSSILLLILFPVYFFLYRPFWQAQQRAADEIRSLSRQLIRTEEATRKALARDLHDEFGQVLGALQLGIETLKNSLPAGQKRLLAQCDRLSRMTAQLGTHVRDVTAQLRPVMLDNLGLVPTLRWHFQQFGLHHPELKLIIELPEAEVSLPADTSLTLYRICQESLTNIARHARATRVIVALKVAGGAAALRIEDDGGGFDPDRTCGQTEGGSPGIGIIGMRERVADGGGSLRIVSLPGAGTRIEVTLPLSSEHAP